MAEYHDKTYLMATKAECYRRCRNAPLKVSELMKAGRMADAGERFREWLHQQGRLAALSEIYDCEVEGKRSRLAQMQELAAVLEVGHKDDHDPTGEFFRGFQTIAMDYLHWIESHKPVL